MKELVELNAAFGEGHPIIDDIIRAKLTRYKRDEAFEYARQEDPNSFWNIISDLFEGGPSGTVREVLSNMNPNWPPPPPHKTKSSETNNEA